MGMWKKKKKNKIFETKRQRVQINLLTTNYFGELQKMCIKNSANLQGFLETGGIRAASIDITWFLLYDTKNDEL